MYSHFRQPAVFNVAFGKFVQINVENFGMKFFHVTIFVGIVKL